MKKMLVLVILVFSTSALLAQDDNVETLFGDGETNVTGWGGPEIKFARYGDTWGVLLGGKGATLINSTLGLGGAGYILMTSHRVEDYIYNYNHLNEKSTYLRDMYGGFLLEYINSSDRLIHFTATALIGGGLAAYTGPINYSNNERYDYDNWVREASSYFFFEPNITVDVNVAEFFRISAGAGYRLVSGLDLPNTESKDIGGLTALLTFKFGDF
jgi:hypothetical protein